MKDKIIRRDRADEFSFLNLQGDDDQDNKESLRLALHAFLARSLTLGQVSEVHFLLFIGLQLPTFYPFFTVRNWLGKRRHRPNRLKFSGVQSRMMLAGGPIPVPILNSQR